MLKEVILVSIVFLTGCTSLKSSNRNDRSEYHILRGANFYKSGYRDKALKEYEMALEKDKQNDIALKEIALIYVEKEDYKKAAYYYQKVLKKDSKDQAALKNLLYISYKNNDTKRSKEYLKKISKENRDEFVLKIEGIFYHAEGNYDLSYEVLKKSINISKVYDEELYKLIYKNLEILSKKYEFKNVLERSLDKFSQDREFVIYYNKIMGDEFNSWDRVNKVLKNYLIKNSSDDEIYYLLAHSYHRMKDDKKAILTLKMFSEKFKNTERYQLLEKKLLI